MRHRSISAPRAALPVLALLAAVALAPAALAGGWAKVTVTDVPADPPAGEPTTIGLNVLQHGITPVSWPGLTVVARDAASGTVIRAAAEPKGSTGSYVVTLVFPNAGEWALTFESKDLVMEGAATLAIAPPVGVGPGATAPAAPGQAFDLGPVLLALLALGAALVVTGLALRRRDAGRETPVSAGA